MADEAPPTPVAASTVLPFLGLRGIRQQMVERFGWVALVAYAFFGEDVARVVDAPAAIERVEATVTAQTDRYVEVQKALAEIHATLTDTAAAAERAAQAAEQAVHAARAAEDLLTRACSGQRAWPSPSPSGPIRP